MSLPMGALICVLACGACSSRAIDAAAGTGPSAAGDEPVACATGPGVTTLTELPVGTQPAVDGSDVILSTGAALIRVPLAGGDAVTITEAPDASAPTVLGSLAYFSSVTLIGGAAKQQSVSGTFSVALTGGDPSRIPELDGRPPLAVDDSALYFDGGGELNRWDASTGERTDLAIDGTFSIDAAAAYADYIYFAAQDLAVGGLTNGVIGRIPRLGGTSESLVSGLGHPWNLVASKAGLYWSEDPPALYGAGPGRIAKSSLSGSAVTTFASVGATSLAFAGGRLYAALPSEIDSFDANGGPPTVVADGLNDAGMLAMAGGNVVWVDPFSKALSSTAPTFVMTACATLR